MSIRLLRILQPLILAGMLLPIVTSAQEVRITQKFRNIAGFEGTANYEYILLNGDTVLNGSFTFNNDLSPSGLTKTAQITGSFKNNQATGEWNFKLGDFNQGDKKTLVDYQYVIEVNGIEKSIKFELNEGIPNGGWLFRMDSVVNSEVTKPLFKSEFEYQDGVPQKSFRIETDRKFMIGRLLRNAVAHDVWSLFSEDGIGEEESWTFNQGLLEEIAVSYEKTTVQIKIDYGDPEKFITTNLDEHYLDIIRLRIQLQDTSITLQEGMSQLLKTDSENYELVLDFFEELNRPLNVEGFRVEVPVFPISGEDSRNLDLIEANLLGADTILKAILEDPQLNILKLSDLKTGRLFRFSQRLEIETLAPLTRILDLRTRDLLEHVSRSEAIEILWPGGFEEHILQLQDSLKNDTSLLSLAENYDFGGRDFLGAAELSHFLLELIKRVDSSVRQKLSSNKREQAFLRQEEILVKKVVFVENHIDSLQEGLPKEVAHTMESLKAFMQSELESYSKMNENLDKLEFSQDLVDCFQRTMLLADALSKVPEQKRAIKKAYQDRVWNPFTQTVMDEDIKRQITRVYDSKLIPFYLDRIENNLSCDNLTKVQEDLSKLHNRMIALRDEDTKRIERRLKRTKDPLDILKLLGLAASDE